MDRAQLATGAAVVVVVASFTATAALYPHLSARIPTHWNVNGVVDGTAPKIVAAWISPVISALALAALVWLPRLDPLRENYASFRAAYRTFALVLTLFLTWIHALDLEASFGRAVPMSVGVTLGLAVLFGSVALLLRVLPPTWFVGIRTPWTLADPEVWRATHRFASWLFLAAAIVILGAAALPPAGAFIVTACAVAAASIASAVYSAFVWRARHGPQA